MYNGPDTQKQRDFKQYSHMIFPRINTLRNDVSIISDTFQNSLPSAPSGIKNAGTKSGILL